MVLLNVFTYQCSHSHFLQVIIDGGICRSKHGELACLVDLICQVVILKKAKKDTWTNSHASLHVQRGAFVFSYDEIRSEQRKLGPPSESRQQALTQLPVWNQNLDTEEPDETDSPVFCVLASSASDLVNDVDESIGGSDVCRGDGRPSHSCNLTEKQEVEHQKKWIKKTVVKK